MGTCMYVRYVVHCLNDSSSNPIILKYQSPIYNSHFHIMCFIKFAKIKGLCLFLCRMNNNERSTLTISFQHDWNDSRLPISRAVYLSTVRLEWEDGWNGRLLLLLVYFYSWKWPPHILTQLYHSSNPSPIIAWPCQ